MLLPDIFRKASGRHSRGKWGDRRDCPGLSHRKINIPCPSHIPTAAQLLTWSKAIASQPSQSLGQQEPISSINPKLWSLQDHFSFSGHQQQWERSLLLLRDLQGFSLGKNNYKWGEPGSPGCSIHTGTH